jgi:hypothetical protein
MVNEISTDNKHYNTDDHTTAELDQETIDWLKKEGDEDSKTLRWLMSIPPEEKNKNRDEWNRIRRELCHRIDKRLAKYFGFRITTDFINELRKERYGYDDDFFEKEKEQEKIYALEWEKKRRR